MTAAIWVALSALLWVTDASPAVFVLGAIVAVLTAVFFVVLDLARSTVGVAWLQQTEELPTHHERDPLGVIPRRELARIARRAKSARGE